MDDQNRNLILATALSMVVILVWFVLFPPPGGPRRPQRPADQTAAARRDRDRRPNIALTPAAGGHRTPRRRR
jgi:YidC/Oxa1 family membrane protein insertase